MRSSANIKINSEIDITTQAPRKAAPVIRVFERGTEADSQEPIDYEAAADALLAANGAIGHDSGIYTSTQLNRKMRLEQERLRRENANGLPENIICELVEQRIGDLIYVSNLSPIQEIVFRLRIGGMGWKNMAAALGIDRRLIKRHLHEAVRRVRAAYNEGPYAGWYEVYLSEVNRAAYGSKK